MITKDDNIAIIGASANTEKYGYKVSKDLIDKGYKVFLINLHGGEILGRTAYKEISHIDAEIDAVIFVTPPSVTEKILPDVYKCGIKKIWMQPGSDSNDAIDFCNDKGIECVHGACIMMK